MCIRDRGYKNKEIATQLGTTEQVIKNYLRNVYDKIGVSDRLEMCIRDRFYVLCAIAASAPLQESQRRRVLRRHRLIVQAGPETAAS